MNKLFNLFDMLSEAPLLGAICVVALMWAIAFMLVPIFQIVEYHSNCKKYGKDTANEIRRRM
jgi:uncharacterized integral membrane protein